MGEIKCLNPWDVQSKHIMDVSGISEALYAGECRYGGGEAYVLYSLEIVNNGRIEMPESVGSSEQTTIRN